MIARGIKRQLKSVAAIAWLHIRQRPDTNNEWLEGYVAAITDVRKALDGETPTRDIWQDSERSDDE